MVAAWFHEFVNKKRGTSQGLKKKHEKKVSPWTPNERATFIGAVFFRERVWSAPRRTSSFL